MEKLYKHKLTNKFYTKSQLGQALRSEIAYRFHVLNENLGEDERLLELTDDEIILGAELYETT